MNNCENNCTYSGKIRGLIKCSWSSTKSDICLTVRHDINNIDSQLDATVTAY